MAATLPSRSSQAQRQAPPMRGLPSRQAIRPGTGEVGPDDTVRAMIRTGTPPAQSRVVDEPRLGDRPARLAPGEVVLDRANANLLAALIEEWEQTGQVDKSKAVQLMQAMRNQGDEAGDPGEAGEGFALGGQVMDWLGGMTGGVLGTSPNVLRTRQQNMAMQSAQEPTQEPAFDPEAFKADLARFRAQTAGPQGIIGGYNAQVSRQGAPASLPAPANPMPSIGGMRQTSFGTPTGAPVLGLPSHQAANVNPAGFKCGGKVMGYESGGGILPIDKSKIDQWKSENQLGMPEKTTSLQPGLFNQVRRGIGEMGAFAMPEVQPKSLPARTSQTLQPSSGDVDYEGIDRQAVDRANANASQQVPLQGQATIDGATGQVIQETTPSVQATEGGYTPAPPSLPGRIDVGDRGEMLFNPANLNRFINPGKGAQGIAAAVDPTRTVAEGIDAVNRGIRQRGGIPTRDDGPNYDPNRRQLSPFEVWGLPTQAVGNMPMPERPSQWEMEHAGWNASVGRRPGADIARLRNLRELQKIADAASLEGIRQAGDIGQAQASAAGHIGAARIASQSRGLPTRANPLQQQQADFINAIQAETDPERQQQLISHYQSLYGGGRSAATYGFNEIEDPDWQRPVDQNGNPDMLAIPPKILVRQNAQTGQAERVQVGKAGLAIPKVGEIQKGHRFLGGDPTVAKNWERV